MTPEILAQRIVVLLAEVQREITRSSDSATYARLQQTRRELFHAWRAARSESPGEHGAAVLSLGAAIDLVVEVATTRAEHMLGKGVTS